MTMAGDRDGVPMFMPFHSSYASPSQVTSKLLYAINSLTNGIHLRLPRDLAILLLHTPLASALLTELRMAGSTHLSFSLGTFPACLIMEVDSPIYETPSPCTNAVVVDYAAYFN